MMTGFPCGSAGKESVCNTGGLHSIPGLGRSPGEGKGYPLQYSSLENSMDCRVRGVAKGWTQLSEFHFHFHMILRGFPGDSVVKESVCQCRRLKICGFHLWVRKIPWRRKWQPTPVFLPGESHRPEEPGGLQSIGSLRIGHYLVTEHMMAPIFLKYRI